MKQLYAFLFLILIMPSVRAQDMRIYDHEWKLSELVIDGQPVTIPESNTEVRAILLQFTADEGSGVSFFSTPVCNSGSGQIQFSATENTFLIEQFITTLMVCNQPQNAAFESSYFSGLFSANIPGIFAYEILGILDGSDRLMLTITAPDGSYARYFDVNLSARSFDQQAFQITPNPAADYIYIGFKNTNSQSSDVAIYDLSGKLCIRKSVSSQQPITVQNLAKGLYFIKISTKDLNVIQKFIKL